jgi:hypothetical protein
MPCTDPRDVTCLAEAFDLTTTDVQQWELELISLAVSLGVVRFSRQARQAAEDDSIPEPAIWRVINEGVPRSKDIIWYDKRQIGINFEGKRRGGGWIRVKVSWQLRYTIVTVHAL